MSVLNKKIIPAIAIPVGIIIVLGIFSFPNEIVCDIENDPDCDDHIKKQHESVWSGPIGVTQYEHRLGENVYLLIRGLQPNEVGTIGVFTPEGILYKSFEYDGSNKSDFNQFFYPDTFAEIEICKPEQLVGTWKVLFADNSYPPLEFIMTDEWLPGAEVSITVVC